MIYVHHYISSTECEPTSCWLIKWSIGYISIFMILSSQLHSSSVACTKYYVDIVHVAVHMQGTLLYSCEEIWIMRTCGKVLQSIHLSASVKSIGPWNKKPSKHVTQNIITYLPCICLCFCFMVTIWCVYTQCTSPTISWKIPKMASLEGSFFSSEDTNCNTHIQRYHTYT